MRLIFMGTPEFAVPTLIELVGRGHDVAAVYTAAAKPAGRGMENRPSAVEREARRFRLPVFTPATLRSSEVAETFRGHGAEAAVGPYTLLGMFHPSQQNTFTGKLTRQMTDEVFTRARALL